MYQLSKKVLEIIKKDEALQVKIGMAMGNGIMAVKMDMKPKKFGKNIACHYDALNTIADYTGMTIHDIRKKII